MAVRLVVSITAAPGKGAQFAQAFKPRCEESRKDAGCQQFEIFQSVFDPDKFALLELWDSPEALADHAKLQAVRPPFAGRPARRRRRARGLPLQPYAVAQVSSSRPA